MKIIENTSSLKTKLWHCLKKENFLVRRACLPENVLYYTDISCGDENDKPKLYKGICETTFKKHYADHKKNFNMKKKTRMIQNYLLNTGS